MDLNSCGVLWVPGLLNSWPFAYRQRRDVCCDARGAVPLRGEITLGLVFSSATPPAQKAGPVHSLHPKPGPNLL